MNGAPDRSAWDRALYEYRRLKLRMDAYYEIGPYAWANEAHSYAAPNRISDPGTADAALAALRVEEDRSDQFYLLVTEAVLALIALPAPDLDSVSIKIDLHKRHLDGLFVHEQETWPAIETDLARLAA